MPLSFPEAEGYQGRVGSSHGEGRSAGGLGRKLSMGVITSYLFHCPNPTSGQQGNSLHLVRGISESIAKVCEHQVGMGDTVYHRQYGC